MMAALFLVFSIAIIFIIMNMRKAAMGVILAGIILTLLMFWHHVSDILKINL